MKKKIFSLFLALALVCALLPQVSLLAHAETISGTCGAEGDGSNLTWTFDPETGLLTIEGSGAMADYFWSIPAPWDEYRSVIKSIILPEGLTSIGGRSFYLCSAVTSVLIPDSVTSIGNNAFNLCRSMTSVTIPDSVMSIGEFAFSCCDSLTSVTIPNSVTSIGNNAFSGCCALTAILVSLDNPSFCSLNGVLFNKTKTELVKYPAGKQETTYVIPDCVTVIGGGAFSGCGSLISVKIPDNVTSIGGAAFSSCYSLTDMTIPDSVTSVDMFTFSDCSALTNVIIGSSVTTIDIGAFDNCSSLASITIPDSVLSISEQAFFNCDSLTSVTIGIGVKSIGQIAFSECNALTSVTIPDSVISIGNWAFSRCTSLASVTIPDSVTNIGSEAFAGCSSLTSVMIPNCVTDIGYHAFGYLWNGEAGDYERMDCFTIYGYNGTAAQSYAEENGFTFVALNSGVGNFTDVKPKDWYADAVLWAVDNGITAGVDEHHFGPKQNCTREQVVTFLWAAKGCPEPESDANPFKDVKKNSWFRKSVLWAVEQGVTGGVDETHFGVGKACDRAQVVMFLWAAAGKPEPETAENKFTDVKKKDYFYSAVLWAVENGVTGGTTPTTFSPKNICTRAQVVTFLYAAYAEK